MGDIQEGVCRDGNLVKDEIHHESKFINFLFNRKKKVN